MKILLVFPRLKNEAFSDPPLGLAYLASYLREKFDLDINILDTAFLPSSNNKLLRHLQKQKPDIVGIYFSTATYDYGIKISRLAKNIGAYTVGGGPHATVLPDTLIQELDALIIGEGEIGFAEMIKAQIKKELPFTQPGLWFRDNGKIIKNDSGGPMTDLNTLPFPARDILDMERYIVNCQYFDSLDMKLRATTMVTSRGCPFRCDYCQPTLNKLFGPRIRLRSPENVVSEMKYLRDEYSIDAIFFHDDTLTWDKKWIEGFCRQVALECPDLIWGCNTRADLIDESSVDMMYRAGLRCLHIGAESASQRILDDIYHKDITVSDIQKAVRISRNKNIRTMCFFMLGAPTETRREINATIRLARNLPLNEAVFNLVSPLPGTYLYNQTEKLGLQISSDWSDFNYYAKSSYRNNTLSLGQLKYLQLKAFFLFYFSLYRLRYTLKHFNSCRGIRKLFLKIKRIF